MTGAELIAAEPMAHFKYEIGDRVHEWDSHRLSLVAHRFVEDGANYYVLHDNSRWPISPRVPEWMVRPFAPTTIGDTL